MNMENLSQQPPEKVEGHKKSSLENELFVKPESIVDGLAVLPSDNFRKEHRLGRSEGFKGTVGLDNQLNHSLGDQMIFEEVDVDPIKFSVIARDALGVAKTIPDGSSDVFSFGVDGNIIKDEEYIDQVDEEIIRMLPNEGVFIGENTVFGPYGSKEIVEDPHNWEERRRSFGIQVLYKQAR